MKTKINLKEFKGSAIAAVVICVVLLGLSIVLGSTREKINQKKTEVTVELGSTMQLHFDATDFFDVDIQKARKFEFDTSKVDLTKVGDYEVNATYRREKFIITVKVVDTTRPEVQMAERVVFTNDIEKANASIVSILASVRDESEYTAKLIRFEKKDMLSTMNEFAVGKLEESIMDFATDKEALSTGTEEIPTQPGIYRCVLEIADAQKNAEYKEVYVVLDKTPALINDADVQTVKVPANMLNEKPTIDKTVYKAHDEVDGIITSEYLSIELEIKDAKKHEWTVVVAYTDRAGNESKSEFLAKVEEDKNQVAGNNNNNNNNNNNKPGGNTGNNNNNQGTNNSGNNQNNTGNNQGNNNGNQNKPSGGGSNNNTQYEPEDANKDGEVSDDERLMYITPEKQACIDAGYGVVVELHGGELYAILMKSADHKIDGKEGWEILFDYLHERDLDGKLGGGWINRDNEWYWYIMEDIEYSPYNNGDGEIIW